jgi:hypothetical protein
MPTANGGRTLPRRPRQVAEHVAVLIDEAADAHAPRLGVRTTKKKTKTTKKKTKTTKKKTKTKTTKRKTSRLNSRSVSRWPRYRLFGGAARPCTTVLATGRP